MTRAVIVSAVRTPVGRYGGGLRGQSAVDLGAVAIEAALARSGMPPSAVDWVVMGHVLQAGAGQNPARQAAVAAGVPREVPAITLNNVCLSSLTALGLAGQLIRAGEVETVVAGGMESMSGAPHLLAGLRFEGDADATGAVDVMINDGLWSTFTGQHMGESSDAVNAELGIGRAEQDAWAARSHRRAADAWQSGRFADEVVAAGIERDEGIRPDTSPQALAALSPAFVEGGTITAGNASQLADGAAALVVTSAEAARRAGVEPLAEIAGEAMCADGFPCLHTVPAIALRRALAKTGLAASDLELVEINEAFASVALHATRMLDLDEEIVNVNGNSVALGHALGSTGARMAVSLVHEMRRRGARHGAATLCGGGGQGYAVVFNGRG
jgi:acetyl-CoA C-acetyltransferase